MSSTAPTIRPGFPFKRLLKDGAYTMLLNLLVAVVITLVGGGKNFASNLVMSLCIGTTAYLIIDIARLLIWGEGFRVNWKGYFAILLVAAPIAQIAGGTLADLLLGMNLSRLTAVNSGNTIRFMLITLLATTGGTVFFALRDRLNRAEAAAATEKAESEAIRRQAMQAQLQLLQAQIEPHMLFNTLANLQGLIAIDPVRAQVMLDQLIQYLRATLTSSRGSITTLAQEFALLEAYLGLMSVRMGARLGFSLDLPQALREHPIAPMLLQPLLENAIIHGLEPKVDGGHVHVAASAADGTLEITVSDTGLGLAADALRPGSAGTARGPGTGLGLANTRERLLAMHGERAALLLEPKPQGGALARLRFPHTAPSIAPP